MPEAEFIEQLSSPAFLIDRKDCSVRRVNAAFCDTFHMNSEDPQSEKFSAIAGRIVSQVIERLGSSESVSFYFDIPVINKKETVLLRCQNSGKNGSNILVIAEQANAADASIDFGMLTQIIPDGLMAVLPTGTAYKIVYVNHTLLQMLDCSGIEFKEKYHDNLLKLVYPDDVPDWNHSLQEQFQAGNNSHFKCRLVKKNGAPIWVSCSARCYQNADRVKMLYCAITDISDIQEFLNRAHDEDQIYSTLISNSRNILAKYDIQSKKIVFTGGLLKQLTGQEMICYHVSDLLCKKTFLKTDSEQIRKAFKMMNKGICGKGFRFDIVTKTGKSMILSANFSYLYDSKNNPVTAVCELSDVTAKISAEEYYDKAITLWFTSKEKCAAALSINLSKQIVIDGFSTLINKQGLSGMSAVEYFSMIEKLIVKNTLGEKIRANTICHILLNAYRENKIHLSYELELEINHIHYWLQLRVTLIQNPKTSDIIALIRWSDISQARLQAQIYQTLLSDRYDFICLLFLKSDSYKIVINIEQNHLIPESLSNGYSRFIHDLIAKRALPDDVEYLQHCFCIKNLESQLAYNEAYSFIGHGTYPDGSPTVKLHHFTYLDKKQQIVLYTRKDITNKAELLSFKYKDRICSIEFANIAYIESYGRKSIIVTQTENYEINEMLSEVQEHLPGRDFIRCHRCYIINIAAVKEIKGNYIYLKDGTEIPVSRTRIEKLRLRISGNKAE